MIIPITLHAWKIFGIGFVITSISGIVCILLGKARRINSMSAVFATTTSVWVVVSLFSAIPFYLDNLGYVDALFEAMSGITTTGATIFDNVEIQPPAILLWRALLHSIGGLGIITIGIAIFPMSKMLSLNNFLYSEHSDAEKRRLPHTRSIVIYITGLYYGMILLCALFYNLAGMSLFDALCHSMSTVSTGGFANYNNSIGHYNNSRLELITIIFMVLGSLPFLDYVKIIKRLTICCDEQVSYFITFIIGAFLFALFWLYGNSDMEVLRLFRYALFTVTSFITSTGYTICDYVNWSFISVLAFFLSCVGGCGGSASGGIKIFRIVILVRSIRTFAVNLNVDSKIKWNNKILSNDEVFSILIFFVVYVLTFAMASIAISYLSSADFVTSISAVSAMLTNSGPGFSNLIGPLGNYAFFNNGAKLLLSFLMLLGRLEMLPIYFCMHRIFALNAKGQ